VARANRHGPTDAVQATGDWVIDSLTERELEALIEQIRQSPNDEGVLESIVRRPRPGEREVLKQGELDRETGLVGDNWSTRGSSRTTDGKSHRDMQLTMMSSRAIELFAQTRDRWPLAGDQLFVDLDLSETNLPAGTRLELGTAMIEVTPQPHTGCRKFVTRFGLEAMKLISSPLGRELRLRGLNAKVARPGLIRVGDLVRKA
jgi:MOSC domain-containing protein YiiM